MNLKSYLLNSFLNELPDINSKLPYQIDKNTVLLSIEYADGKILTRYKVPNQKFQIDSDQRFTKEMISKLQKQVCLDETKKGLINVDVDFLSQYQDALGQVMFEFLTNRSTCLAINLAH